MYRRVDTFVDEEDRRNLPRISVAISAFSVFLIYKVQKTNGQTNDLYDESNSRN